MDYSVDDLTFYLIVYRVESHIEVLENLLHVLQLVSTRESGVEALGRLL